MAGAPIGNTNAKKDNRLFGETLRRAIAQDDGKRVRECCETLLTLAAKGESWACQMLADRLDGKAPQGITLSGDPDAPLLQRIERVIVDSK